MITIAQISDLHLDHRQSNEMGIDTRRNFEKIIDDVRKRNVDEIILTGDLAEDSAVEWFFKKLNELKKKYSYVFGNHDKREVFNNGKSDKPCYYSQEVGGCCGIFLDSGNGLIEESQLAWMEKEISKACGTIIVFIHHPIIDCETRFMDIKYPLKNRDTVFKILAGKNEDIVIFCGHYHMEDERSIGNIRQYAAPSVFYQIKRECKELEVDNKPIGYRLIKMDGNISSEIIRVP